MRLHHAAGLADDALSPEMLAAARQFFLCGGALSLAEWAEQSGPERQALLQARAGLGTSDEPCPGEAGAPGARARAARILEARQELLRALEDRHPFPEGVRTLVETLDRLELCGLAGAVADGYPLREAVARFEHAWDRHQAAAAAG